MTFNGVWMTTRFLGSGQIVLDRHNLTCFRLSRWVRIGIYDIKTFMPKKQYVLWLWVKFCQSLAGKLHIYTDKDCKQLYVCAYQLLSMSVHNMYILIVFVGLLLLLIYSIKLRLIEVEEINLNHTTTDESTTDEANFSICVSWTRTKHMTRYIRSWVRLMLLLTWLML